MPRFKKLILLSCSALLILCSCKENKKHIAKLPLIVDKKELECKRKNWNRVPRSAGYVQDVVVKREYKQVKNN